MQKGLLIVISAPSGSGKSTVREELMRREDFAYSVSATTRAPRAGEKNGVDYWFVTREQFEEKIRNGDMLEHAIYNGNYYDPTAGSILFYSLNSHIRISRDASSQ